MSNQDHLAFKPNSFACPKKLIHKIVGNYSGNGWYHFGVLWYHIEDDSNGSYNVLSWNADPRPYIRNILESEVRT